MSLALSRMLEPEDRVHNIILWYFMILVVSRPPVDSDEDPVCTFRRAGLKGRITVVGHYTFLCCRRIDVD